MHRAAFTLCLIAVGFCFPAAAQQAPATRQAPNPAQTRAPAEAQLQAIRDAENRVMFCGYNPLPYKLTIWTISAVMCGIAGALYVPQVGIINPGEMSTAASIEIAVWTAVGGRATLVGPIVGAFLVNGAKSWLTVAFPEFWLYFLGVLFIAVTLWMPQGVVGLVKKFKKGGQA